MMARWQWMWVSLWLAGCAQPADHVVEVVCPDIVAGCTLPVEGGALRFDRVPRPMERFGLEVTLPAVHALHARFRMQGMDMGLNRYRLIAEGDGRWRAEVMLPACVQGRSDWELQLEADGVTYAVPFSSAS